MVLAGITFHMHPIPMHYSGTSHLQFNDMVLSQVTLQPDTVYHGFEYVSQ